MAAQTPPALDESVWRNDQVLEWWTSGQHGIQPPPYPAMDERMIHRYFSESPYFDWTTTNGLWLEQSKTDLRLWNLVHNREDFERELSKRLGKEYVITGTPQQVQVPGQPVGFRESSGVYTIRKQNRERKDERETLETLGSYYTVGPNVFQAPSLMDVVGNRLLSAATSINEYFEKASSLPTFAPTTGHTYFPPSSKATATGSTNLSPTGSRQGSVAPSVDSQTLRSGSVVPETQLSAQLSTIDAQHVRLLAQSLADSIQYADEYMDGNPIIGQPGNFSFTSSTAAIRKRKAEEEAAAIKAATASKTQSEKEAASRAASPKVEKAPSPPPVFTEAKAGAKSDKDRRGSKMADKAKRRKSRPNAQSPTTPISTASTLPPNAAS